MQYKFLSLLGFSCILAFLSWYQSFASMASAPSSTSASTSSSNLATPPTMTNTITHINPSLLLLSNMSSMMTVKLDYSNYIVWKHQIEVILETYSMIDAINDTVMAPNQFLKDSFGNITTKVNPDFLIWRNWEQALFTFLNSTLSPFCSCSYCWVEIWSRCLESSGKTFCLNF